MIIVKKPKIRFKGFTETWEQRKLCEVSSIVSGGTPDTKKEEYWDGNIDWYAPAEISEQIYVNDSERKISELGLKNSSAKLLPANKTILFTSRAGIGKMAILAHDACTNQGFQSLVLNDNNVPYFVYSMGNQIKLKANKLASGSTFAEISGRVLGNIELFFPDKNEQMQIGSLFSKLDNLITLHQRKCENLKKLKKFMLQKLFPQNGKNVPKVRFLNFTDTWEQRKFNNLFVERRDKTKEENEDTLLSCAIDGMYLNSELFSHFRGSSTIGYLKVKKNDLILSAQNLHLGNANVNLRFESGIISPAYKVFNLIDCEPNYVQAWVKKDSTKNFFLSCTTEGASVCRKNIDWNALKNNLLFLPNLDEQKKIGSFFSKLDHLITLHQRKCDKLKEVKKYMLQNMFA